MRTARRTTMRFSWGQALLDQFVPYRASDTKESSLSLAFFRVGRMLFWGVVVLARTKHAYNLDYPRSQKPIRPVTAGRSIKSSLFDHQTRLQSRLSAQPKEVAG